MNADKSTYTLWLFSLIVAAVLFPVFAQDSYAQDFEQMRNEIQARQDKARNDIEVLRTEIRRIEGRLTEAATEYEQRYSQFQNLQREISLRDQILVRLQEEQDEIRNELNVLQQAYDQYTAELEGMIENYQTILRHLYVHGRDSELMLLITARSFNEMQVKSHYLRRFEAFREEQIMEVREAQERIRTKEKEMTIARERNAASLEEAEAERRVFEQRRRQQESLIAELQRDRSALESRLAQSRQRVEDLNRTINELIAEYERVRREEEERFQMLERERLRRLAEAERIQNPAEREREIARFSEPVRRPDAIMLSEQELRSIGERFRSRRGNIQWPVNSGAVTTRFGNRVDPVYRTTIPNFGIEITTEPQSQVMAVHDGFVSDVVDVHGYDTMILINHGNYITAYGNLTESFVRRNTVVKAGDVIGLSGDETSYNGSVLFFLVREGNKNVDPQIWLTSRPGPIP